MSSANYVALVRVVLDKTGLQPQINAAMKSAKITVKADLDASSMQNLQTKWNNRIANLKFSKPAVFNNADVKKQLDIFQDYMKVANMGFATRGDVEAQWSNVTAAVNKTSAAMRGNL